MRAHLKVYAAFTHCGNDGNLDFKNGGKTGKKGGKISQVGIS